MKEIKNEVQNEETCTLDYLQDQCDKAIKAVSDLTKENQYLKGQISVYEQLIKVYAGK